MGNLSAIRCLVIDDEPLANDLLAFYIRRIPNLQLKGQAFNALEALRLLQEQPIDLLFLDINMPQVNGIDFLRTLQRPPRTIFTTANPAYALEGYELDVVDFLLKPITLERFIKAVNKAFLFHNIPQIIQDHSAETVKKEAFVFFRVDRQSVKVAIRDILFVESMRDYIKVYTEAGILITKMSLTSVQEILPETDFLRVHRSYLINKNQISTFNSQQILIGKKIIPIGKLYHKAVQPYLVSDINGGAKLV